MMTQEAHGLTIFCDDIRHELGGKLTLVGCYGSELQFSGPAPGLLPTFACLINIRISISLVFKTIAVYVLKETAGVKEEMFRQQVEFSSSIKSSDVVEIPSSPSEKVRALAVPVQWISVVLPGETTIKVRATIDGGEEIRLGVLKCVFQEIEGDALKVN